MTLTELQQVKKDIDNGVIIAKATWLKVLDHAIANTEKSPGEWIEWNGGANPVGEEIVEYVLRSNYTNKRNADNLMWNHDGDRSDIVRYRVLQ